MRYNYACSEFYITSAIYYYYLQQREEAISSINSVNFKWLATDSCQWMYYHYLKGSAFLCSGSTVDEQNLSCFDELYMAWKAASLQKVIYFEANGLQSISDMLAAKDSYQFFVGRRGYRLVEMNIPVDSLMPLRMAQRSLDIFNKYQDPYQVAGSLVTIAKYYNIHVADFRIMGRATQGVRLINLDKRGDEIASVCKVNAEEEIDLEEQTTPENTSDAPLNDESSDIDANDNLSNDNN